ncbi:hypothetical protein H5410_001140 [Solanum commersonii]|uniref:rRNA methyltransferase n=1 Tax=Solanum commersonii TaxID=4109 RepID=A0A9J6AZA5_SOLCO|nr:hypothetical protein H5410_001140 [Solanum commersonii]
MGKLKGRDRRDKYYHLARESRYRSRAAFKLMQLNSKFSFLTSSQSVLDLCAAPGGWMQVVVRKAPVGSLVIGVDIDPIRPIAGAISLQEDITTAKCKSTIKRIIAQKGCSGFDLILHDGSPNMGGAWAMEATMQNSLVIDSVKLAAQFLLPNGTFVTKVFRSQDYTAVLYCLRQLFEKVEVEKPLASRSESAEIYVIRFKYKAPAKIDRRLLDIKHLFQGGKEPLKVVDVLRGAKQKRHRDGYEDGETVLRKVCSAANFVWSDIKSLGSVTSIMFDDPASLPMRDHPLTTEEVRTLCEDLRVLGEQDLKHLSKWRKLIRKALAPSESISNPKVVIECEREEDEDTRLVKEMEELKETELRKTKREKRALAKRQAKDKAREVLGMQSDAAKDGFADPELFSLTLIKNFNLTYYSGNGTKRAITFIQGCHGHPAHMRCFLDWIIHAEQQYYGARQYLIDNVVIPNTMSGQEASNLFQEQLSNLCHVNPICSTCATPLVINEYIHLIVMSPPLPHLIPSAQHLILVPYDITLELHITLPNYCSGFCNYPHLPREWFVITHPCRHTLHTRCYLNLLMEECSSPTQP